MGCEGNLAAEPRADAPSSPGASCLGFQSRPKLIPDSSLDKNMLKLAKMRPKTTKNAL
jgi:hypothetical protein